MRLPPDYVTLVPYLFPTSELDLPNDSWHIMWVVYRRIEKVFWLRENNILLRSNIVAVTFVIQCKILWMIDFKVNATDSIDGCNVY